jgi:hypothetical protein
MTFEDFLNAMVAADPDTSNGTQEANVVAYNAAFIRGLRNCAQGDSFSSSWGTSRQVGWKAAQALGLFDVWSAAGSDP